MDAAEPVFSIAARALHAAHSNWECIDIHTSRYTDYELAHDIALTLAGCDDADVVTVRVHSRIDGMPGEVLLDAKRVIGRMAADAQVAAAVNEALDADTRKLIESYPPLLKRAELEWRDRLVA